MSIDSLFLVVILMGILQYSVYDIEYTVYLIHYIDGVNYIYIYICSHLSVSRTTDKSDFSINLTFR